MSSVGGVILNLFVMFIILIAKVKLPGHQVTVVYRSYSRTRDLTNFKSVQSSRLHPQPVVCVGYLFYENCDASCSVLRFPFIKV